MNEQEFLERLSELMDTEEVINMESSLSDIEEWDSLSYVSFLAMCTKFLKRRIEPQRVKEAKTVKDLYGIIIE